MINMLRMFSTLLSQATLINAANFCSKNAEAILSHPGVVLSNVYQNVYQSYTKLYKAVSNSNITDIAAVIDDPVKLFGKLASSVFQTFVGEPIENIQSFITMQEGSIHPSIHNISIEYDEFHSLGDVYYDCNESF